MKHYLSFFITLFFSGTLYFNAQAQAIPVPDTTKPVMPIAGFDVIIKKNGDFIYGLVQEVGLDLIKYKRTDIPDGPTYTILRSEVHAISYRNQVKEFMDGKAFMDTVTNKILPPVRSQLDDSITVEQYQRPAFLKNGDVRLGLGFIRGYTKVPDAGQYAAATTFPTVIIGYDAPYRNQMRLGLQLAFGSHKFTGKQYDDYDSTQSDIRIKENTFAIHAYARYAILDIKSAFQPYLIAGLGLHTANVRTNYDINFLNSPDKVVQVATGSRAVGLGVLARIGTNYYFNKQIAAFADVGFGPSVLNLGITASMD